MSNKINDNYETVTCRICYEQCGRVYGAHLRKHGISSKEYKEKFPNAPLTPPKDKKNTSKNSGKHMKTEKYKKMFSEKFKGENNPMHKSNTTEQQRKEISPFSREFYKKRFPNITESEIDLKIKEVTDKVIQDRLLPSNKEYWIERGHNEKEAIKKVSERQTTFSKDICIEKYGEEEGVKIWEERQKRWMSTLDSKTDEEKRLINQKKIENNQFYSKVSQELFWEIHKELELTDRVKFKEHNGEYFLYDSNTKSHYMYDYVNRDSKKCIEFNGWFWHCKPTIYEANYYNKVKKKTAQELWDLDEYKENLIKDRGFDLLVIWEDDYRKNKEEIVEKCIEFLLS